MLPADNALRCSPLKSSEYRRSPGIKIDNSVLLSLESKDSINERFKPSPSKICRGGKDNLKETHSSSIHYEKENMNPVYMDSLGSPALSETGILGRLGTLQLEKNDSEEDSIDLESDSTEGGGDDDDENDRVEGYGENELCKSVNYLSEANEIRPIIPRSISSNDDDYVYSSGGSSTETIISEGSSSTATSYDPTTKREQFADGSFSRNILPQDTICSEYIKWDGMECIVPAEIISDNDYRDREADSSYSTDDDFVVETTNYPRSKAASTFITDSQIYSSPNSTPTITKHQLVQPKMWRLGQKIGSGSFGVVHMAMNDLTGNLMAVKSLNILARNNSHFVTDLQREVDLMRSLSHPNIVRYYGAEMDEEMGMLHIFQEWVPGGSVTMLLDKFGVFPVPVVRRYLRQILQGLSFLHQKGIMHRDIKGGNILISEQGTVKLADFGASRYIYMSNHPDDQDLMTSMTLKGTPYFMAPEVYEGKYNSKADIWSLAGVILQMVTGKPPWKEMGFSNPMSLYYFLKSSDEMPSFSGALTGRLKKIVISCFHRKSMLRPNADTLLKDPFFQELEGEEDDEDTKFMDDASCTGLSDKTKQMNNSDNKNKSTSQSPPRINIMLAQKRARKNKYKSHSRPECFLRSSTDVKANNITRGSQRKNEALHGRHKSSTKCHSSHIAKATLENRNPFTREKRELSATSKSFDIKNISEAIQVSSLRTSLCINRLVSESATCVPQHASCNGNDVTLPESYQMDEWPKWARDKAREINIMSTKFVGDYSRRCATETKLIK